MSAGSRVRRVAERLADSNDPGSLAGRARERRWREFECRFPEISQMRVLDLGGTPRYWRSAPVQPLHVTVLNLLPEVADEPWIDSRAGDATEPTAERYDLVVSNSLVEHLPQAARKRFARVVAEAAPRCWVQTPYRHFPVEPHWLFPGAQYMGRPARRWLAEHWPATNFVGMPDAVIESEVDNIRLLTARELAELLPGAEIWRERFGPLTKSLVAIRDQ